MDNQVREIGSDGLWVSSYTLQPVILKFAFHFSDEDMGSQESGTLPRLHD